jgi:hypothetical protein
MVLSSSRVFWLPTVHRGLAQSHGRVYFYFQAEQLQRTSTCQQLMHEPCCAGQRHELRRRCRIRARLLHRGGLLSVICRHRRGMSSLPGHRARFHRKISVCDCDVMILPRKKYQTRQLHDARKSAASRRLVAHLRDVCTSVCEHVVCSFLSIMICLVSSHVTLSGFDVYRSDELASNKPDSVVFCICMWTICCDDLERLVYTSWR